MQPWKFAAVVVSGLVVAVAGLLLLRELRREAPPAPLRVASGEVQDGGSAVRELAAGRPLVAGAAERNVLEGAASVRLAAGTRFLVARYAPLTLHLESGRAWVAARATPVTVTAFQVTATVVDGACELVAWEDKDHFKNTTVRAWQGLTRVQGGPGLKGTAELRYGQSVLVDDAAMHAVTPFDATSPDAWQAWNRDLR